MSATRQALIDALKAAEQFIVNGVELGYIRMPDSDMPDPAHKTLPKIRAALRELQQRRALVPAPDAQAGRMRAHLEQIAAWDGEHPDEAAEWMLAIAQSALSAPPVACETGEGETR